MDSSLYLLRLSPHTLLLGSPFSYLFEAAVYALSHPLVQGDCVSGEHKKELQRETRARDAIIRHAGCTGDASDKRPCREREDATKKAGASMRDAALGGDVAQTGPRVHLAERERTPLPKGDVGGRRKRILGRRRRKRRRGAQPRPPEERCRRFGSANRRRRRRRRRPNRGRRRSGVVVMLKERDARNIGTRADMKGRERSRDGRRRRRRQERTRMRRKKRGWRRRRDIVEINRTRRGGAGRSGDQIDREDVELGRRIEGRKLDRTRRGGGGRSGNQFEFGREDVEIEQRGREGGGWEWRARLEFRRLVRGERRSVEIGWFGHRDSNVVGSGRRRRQSRVTC